jgi:hypothetical protein
MFVSSMLPSLSVFLAMHCALLSSHNYHLHIPMYIIQLLHTNPIHFCLLSSENKRKKVTVIAPLLTQISIESKQVMAGLRLFFLCMTERETEMIPRIPMILLANRGDGEPYKCEKRKEKQGSIVGIVCQTVKIIRKEKEVTFVNGAHTRAHRHKSIQANKCFQQGGI